MTVDTYRVAYVDCMESIGSSCLSYIPVEAVAGLLKERGTVRVSVSGELSLRQT